MSNKDKKQFNGLRIHPLPFTLFALAAALLIFAVIWAAI